MCFPSFGKLMVSKNMPYGDKKVIKKRRGTRTLSLSFLCSSLAALDFCRMTFSAQNTPHLGAAVSPESRPAGSAPPAPPPGAGHTSGPAPRVGPAPRRCGQAGGICVSAGRKLAQLCPPYWDSKYCMTVVLLQLAGPSKLKGACVFF